MQLATEKRVGWARDDERGSDQGLEEDGWGPQHTHMCREAKSLNFKPTSSILYLNLTSIFITGYRLNPLLLKTHIMMLQKKKTANRI